MVVCINVYMWVWVRYASIMQNLTLSAGLTFHWRCSSSATWTWVTSQSQSRTGKGTTRVAVASSAGRGQHWASLLREASEPLVHSPHRSCKEKTKIFVRNRFIQANIYLKGEQHLQSSYKWPKSIISGPPLNNNNIRNIDWVWSGLDRIPIVGEHQNVDTSPPFYDGRNNKIIILFDKVNNEEVEIVIKIYIIIIMFIGRE